MVTLMSVTSALHFVHSHSRTPVCCFRSWLKKVSLTRVLLILSQIAMVECHINWSVRKDRVSKLLLVECHINQSVTKDWVA